MKNTFFLIFALGLSLVLNASSTCCPGSVKGCDVRTNKIVCDNYAFSQCSCDSIPEGMVKLSRPKNAVFSDGMNGWDCKTGYVQRKDKCIKLNLPKNSTLNNDGHTWSCNDGYIKYRNKCKKINNPKNSYIDGNDWKCNKGYKRFRHRCIKE